MEWQWWLLIVWGWGELYGYLKRRLGRVEGWHEGWDEREAIVQRDERAAAAYRADLARPAACVHCGEPTGHDGRVCYACAHAAVVPAELGGEG